MRTAFQIILILCFVNKSYSQTNCVQFELKGFSSNTNNWRNEVPFERLSRSDYDLWVKRFPNFASEDDYRSLYHVCNLKRGKLDGLVVVVAYTGQVSIYFVPKTGSDLFLLASLEANADEYLIKKSKFVGEILKTESIYSSSEENRAYKDSVVSYYGNIKINEFLKVRSDSVRTYFNNK